MAKRKVVAGMIVYQNELLVGPAIKSVLDFVDHIVIIDGSPWGPSTDGTRERLNEIINDPSINPDKKITAASVRGSIPNKTDQRNLYIEQLQRFWGRNTWLLVVDADEVWKPEDLQMVSNAMDLANTNPHETSICIEHVHFWRNFGTLIQGGIWSGPKANVLFRVNRFWKGTTYKNHNSLYFQNDQNQWESLDIGERRLYTRARVYHYGHALNVEAEWFRTYYMARRGDYKANNVETDEQCREFARQNAYNWVHGEGHGEGVWEEPFYGEHPKEIQALIDRKPEVLTWNTPETLDFDAEIERIEKKYIFDVKQADKQEESACK